MDMTWKRVNMGKFFTFFNFIRKVRRNSYINNRFFCLNIYTLVEKFFINTNDRSKLLFLIKE